MQNLSETNILEKLNTKELSSKKLEGGKKFQLITEYTPAGDQPKAISFLKTEILNNKKNQVLLGVTGSGKTFTMAKIIEELNRPALILAPNKTLAAQLYGEMKTSFLIMQLNTLFLIMITTLQKLTFQDPTLI